MVLAPVQGLVVLFTRLHFDCSLCLAPTPPIVPNHNAPALILSTKRRFPHQQGTIQS